MIATMAKRADAPTGADDVEAGPARKEKPRKRTALTVDWHVSLALMIAIGMETAGALVWAGAAGARISQLESQLARRSEEVQRLARLEAQVGALGLQLDRIEARLGSRLPARDAAAD